ncbi:MAG TPA: tRNA (adenine-N1)-methyltransferase [Pyrodictium sp.]|nr:tRNA (adenine-N1)-methyltransferase [Pyrodictium sp.]
MVNECCKDVICENCLALLYIDERRRFVFRVRRGGRQGSDKGVLDHDTIIGLPYGSKVRLNTGVEAYVLRPTLRDFMERYFERKSQVIYPKDHGMILFLSGIGPGSRVIEVGVGSGFTTAMLAWFVGEKGKVYAYEVRIDMLEVAKRNLERIGLLDRVELKLRDARIGFDEKNVDAVIVDMPDPWSILDAAYEALRPSGSFVAFMPSINQVQRLLLALHEHNGFEDITIVEVLSREYQPLPDALRPKTTMIGHTGYLLAARKVYA